MYVYQLTFSQLKPIVGTVFKYWSNFSLYRAVVLPAESRPSITTCRVPFNLKIHTQLGYACLYTWIVCREYL